MGKVLLAQETGLFPEVLPAQGLLLPQKPLWCWELLPSWEPLLFLGLLQQWEPLPSWEEVYPHWQLESLLLILY